MNKVLKVVALSLLFLVTFLVLATAMRRAKKEKSQKHYVKPSANQSACP